MEEVGEGTNVRQIHDDLVRGGSSKYSKLSNSRVHEKIYSFVFLPLVDLLCIDGTSEG